MSGELDLGLIHEAVAAQLRAHIERPCTVYAWDPGSTRQYPCLVVEPGDPWVEYHETFGDNALAGIELRVVAMVLAEEQSQRIALADFASAGPSARSSVMRAVEADVTFGGTCQSAVCYRVHPPTLGDDGTLACVFDVSATQHRGG